MPIAGHSNRLILLALFMVLLLIVFISLPFILCLVSLPLRRFGRLRGTPFKNIPVYVFGALMCPFLFGIVLGAERLVVGSAVLEQAPPGS